MIIYIYIKFKLFPYLEEMAKGQIERIYSIDEDLYNKLKIINKDIREKLNKYIDMKDGFYRTYRRHWKEYLDSEPRNFSQENLLSQIDIQYFLWEENYDLVKREIRNWMEKSKSRSSAVVPLTDEQIDEMIGIAKKDVNDSKALIPDIEKSIHDIIENDVIPKIENHIRNSV